MARLETTPKQEDHAPPASGGSHAFELIWHGGGGCTRGTRARLHAVRPGAGTGRRPPGTHGILVGQQDCGWRLQAADAALVEARSPEEDARRQGYLGPADGPRSRPAR